MKDGALVMSSGQGQEEEEILCINKKIKREGSEKRWLRMGVNPGQEIRQRAQDEPYT